MTPRRAFWQALGLVAIPSLVLWTAFLSLVGYYSKEWPLYLTFFLVPIVITFPIIYYRYRKYGNASPRRILTKRQHWSFAVAGIILASLFVGGSFLKHSGWDVTSNLALGFGCICMALDHVLKALKNQSTEAPVPSVK